MQILIDTNVLVRAAMVTDAECAVALQSILMLRRLGHEPSIVPQVLYEYWVVATRPKAQNGLAMSVTEVDRDVTDLCRDFTLLRDSAAIFHNWRRLVGQYQVVGKRAHDARLVAAMLRHGVSHLLSFNEQDFSRFSEITVVTPHAAISLPPVAE